MALQSKVDGGRVKGMIIFCSIILLFANSSAYGWYDKTHLAVAQAVGYERWYNTAGADIAKLKAGNVEGYNHFCNNLEDKDVTPELVLSQVKNYNNPHDSKGHLYGAIVGSLWAYKTSTGEFKYAEHHIAYCVHYVEDLSQPFHNLPNDEFNIQHHNKNDGTVNEEALKTLEKIKAHMYPIFLRTETFEADLAREIARVANEARHLGLRLKKENRDMTKEEAYRQLGHSASLLQAILKYLGKLPNKE
jgi:hypothetical protein